MLACSGACAGLGRRAPAAREQVAESPARCFPDSLFRVVQLGQLAGTFRPGQPGELAPLLRNPGGTARTLEFSALARRLPATGRLVLPSDPVPYQAVLLAVLLLNVYFAYRLMRLLGAGEWAAALVALICCYHGGVANLYYNAAFVYDAMCCCLYLAALTFYVGIRGRDRLPGVGQTIVFLALLLAALNAKEMAVSIPPMLLVYEWVYHAPAKKDRQSLVGWVRGPARTTWFAAALVLLDVYSKVAGPAAMTAAEAYRPVFALDRVRTFQVALLQDLFFSWSWKPGWILVVGLYAVMAFIAWRRAGFPILRFLFNYLLVAPLPIEFLPGRREACFALLMFGGAAFASVVFTDVVQAAASLLSPGIQTCRAARSLRRCNGGGSRGRVDRFHVGLISTTGLVREGGRRPFALRTGDLPFATHIMRKAGMPNASILAGEEPKHCRSAAYFSSFFRIMLYWKRNPVSGSSLD
jgi:hypothetical protein